MSGGQDTTDTLVGDRRAVTIKNTPAVATLLLFTVIIGGGLGAAVMFAEEEDTGPPSANFTFKHFDRNSALIVTFDKGDSFTAGELLVSSREANATWAAVADTNNSTTVESGDTIQLSQGSEFGEAIISTDVVRIYWTGGNETIKLDEWSGG